jgi:cyclopropane-fatty-acyl-phospholipid synthase
MSLVPAAIHAAERLAWPDLVTRAGIGLLVGRTRGSLAREAGPDDREFAAAMAARAIAEHCAAANGQHYELPPEFFGLVLGPRRKYSCCLYPDGVETLAEAERAALDETIRHAALADGQRILELGCGWGSLSLTLAERFPAAEIVAVSNAAAQGAHIRRQARTSGLANLTVVTADMNAFAAEGRFDRVVSIEMFEHMANWRALLGRIRTWLAPDGRLFVHVFSHRSRPYRFDHDDPADWIARHFFTGGIMPSHGLIRQFQENFAVEEEWRWSGRHYARTALDWLANFDARRPAVEAVLRPVYGADAPLWQRRWRLFFLATAGLFGHAKGGEWGVSHYRLSPAPA